MKRTMLTVALFAVLSAGAAWSYQLTALSQAHNAAALACSADPGFDCATALSSAQSRVLGIPISTFALALFCFLSVHSLLIVMKSTRQTAADSRPQSFFAVPLALGSIAGVIALYYAYVSAFVLHAICPYCLALDGLIAATVLVSCFGLNVPLRRQPSALLKLLREFSPAGILRTSAAGCAACAIAFLSIAKLPADSPQRAQLSASTPIAVTEFIDFECPACKRMAAAIRELQAAHPGKVNVHYVAYPLCKECNSGISGNAHPNSCLAAKVGEALKSRGKFDAYCERLLSDPRTPTDAVLAEAVTALGEDPAAIRALAEQNKTLNLLGNDLALARQFGVRQTPTLRMNGRQFNAHDALAQLQSALVSDATVASATLPHATPQLARFSAGVAARATNGPVNLTLDGSQVGPPIDGIGVDIEVSSWKNGQLKPALDMLTDTLGASLFRVVQNPLLLEPTDHTTDLENMNMDYYKQIFEAPAVQDGWNTIAYLNQKGIPGSSIMLNMQGAYPTWLGGGGSDPTAPNYITPGKEGAYAEMIAAWIYYGRVVRGLQFNFIGPQNEPGLLTQGPDVDPTQDTLVLHELANRLQAKGVGAVGIVAPDTAGDPSNYVQAFMADSVVAAQIAHFGFHGYGGSAGPGQSYPGKTYWLDETSDSCGSCDQGVGVPPSGEWTFATNTVDDLTNDLNNGLPGICIWMGYDAIDTTVNNWGIWGLLAYDQSSGIYTPRKRFWAYTQMMKFIRPAMRTIDETDTFSNISIVATANAPAGEITVVGHNSGSATTINAQMLNLPAIGSLAYYVTDNISQNVARQNDVSVNSDTFTVAVPANCVFTLTTFTGALAIATPSPLPSGTAGLAYSQALIASGGAPPYSWSIASGSLPPGLSLSTSGVISGTPSAPVSASFTVQLTDSKNTTVTKDYSLTITGPNIAPSGTAYRWFGNSTAASNANKNAAPGLNDGNLSVDVPLTGSADDVNNAYEAAGIVWSSPQTFNSVAFINGTYTSSQDGVFDANFALQTTTDGATWTTISNWTLTPPYDYNSAAATGALYTFTGPAVTVLGVRCVGQVHTSDTGVNSWWDNCREVQVFSAGTIPLTITTTSPLPVAKQGAAYSTSFTASGGTPPYSWMLASGTLPAGLALNSAGTLSGTPTTSGTATFAVQVTDSASKTATQTFALSVDQAPTVATAASATPSPVTAKTCTLSVLGADDGGEPNLKYTWVAMTAPASVTFSANGTNAAKTSTATFTAAGAYVFQVTIADAYGLTATSSVSVTVDQTLTALTVAPASATLAPNATQQFTAAAKDQFGKAMSAPAMTWAVGGGGTISTAGLFTAGATPGGPFTVTASSGSVSATAAVTISNTINVAPNGTAYRWFGMSSSTGNSNKTAAPKLNDGDLSVNVDLSGAQNDTVNAWEAAGVTWAAAQSVTRVVFHNGTYDPSEDGVFDSNFKLQSSADGTTWSDVSGWSLSPAYAYNSPSAGGVAYTFTGPALPAKGIRCIGQVHTAATGVNSWYVNVTEVQVYGGSTAQTPPAITSAASATPNPASVNQAVTFSVAAADADGDTLSYAWDFGDGATGTGATVTHTYAAAGTFTAKATVTDGNGGSVSSSVSVTVNAQSVSQTLLTTQQPLNSFSDGANVNYELGMRFQSDAAGQITAIRFWKSSSETGTHTGNIWDANGALLATIVFTNETASGWQEQALATPLNISANTEYLVSVNTGNTYYVADDTGLSTQITNGHLSSIVGGNGRYGSVGTYPTNTWMSTNYFRDVRFVANP